MSTDQHGLWILLFACNAAWNLVQGTPQFLACGSDNDTRIRAGDTVMGLAVGAFATPNIIAISISSQGKVVKQFTPGEVLTVHLTGFPREALFAMRINDGGGKLDSAPKARAVTNKCPTQVFSADPSTTQEPTDVLLKTPCDNSPATISVSVVAATSPRGPMYFADATILRGNGRDPKCPDKSHSFEPLYPFNTPINETCPNGAAAQHRAPCPTVACRYPVGKEGTCLTSSDGSVPDRNGSVNTEARVDLLTDEVTPISHHYVTGAAPPSRAWSRDMTDWMLRIDGEVEKPRNFSMHDLQAFPHVTRRYVLECAGNWGRGIVPAAAQADWWNIGAVGCAEWTGVLLRDVLHSVGVTSKGVFVAYIGEDDFLSRGIPILKALDGHSMLAWAMNGEPLPAFHGFPLRLLAPGYPGSAQGKWLKRLWIRDRVHDGLGMNGKSYKLPVYPLRPGAYGAPDSDFKIFTQQPVRSLIVKPPRCTVTSNLTIWLEGKAWSGAGDVSRVEVSYDAGTSWRTAGLSHPVNKWAWQRWEVKLTLPSPGVWFIYARATDHTGATQPMLVPGWNPGGYANNQAMMVDIEVEPLRSSLLPQAEELEERCSVCGHDYDPLKDCGGMDDPTMDCGEGVDFEALPESWRCPVCGVFKNRYHLVHSHPTTAAPTPLPLKTADVQCHVCDHVYDPLKDCGGMDNLGEDCGHGVPFESLADSWRCPLCGAEKAQYREAHPHPEHVSITTHTLMDTMSLFVTQSGIYIAVALASSAGILTMYGLATKTFLLITLTSGAAIIMVKIALDGMAPLVVGHAIGMLICWSLMVVGTSLRRGIVSTNCKPHVEQARVPHAVMQSCACIVGIMGLALIFENHIRMGASQFGLDSGNSAAHRLHAILGWFLIALMMLQGAQGWLKFLRWKMAGTISHLRHPQIGRVLVFFSGGNIVVIIMSFREMVGDFQALFISMVVMLASSLACMISGPQPVLARVNDEAAAAGYQAMPK